MTYLNFKFKNFKKFKTCSRSIDIQRIFMSSELVELNIV